MSFHVYLIHNVLNNKVYVGKTKDPAKRWRKHMETALSSRKDHKFYLHHALKKYGTDNFVFTVIQQFSTEAEQDLAEKYWIQYFNSRDSKFGYNLTDGGEGCVGRILSQSTKNKISETLKGHDVPEKTREKIGDSLTGFRRSQEFKNKVSQGMMGRVLSDSSRQKIGVGVSGENNGSSKLNEQKVKEIRKLSSLGWTTEELIKLFNVSDKTIRNVIRRISWKHVG